MPKDLRRKEVGGEVDVRYEDIAPGLYGVTSVEPRHTQALDYDGSGNLIYEGRSALGSSKAAAVWQIRKLVYTAGNLTDILWADGNTSFDNVWNDRVALSYS